MKPIIKNYVTGAILCITLFAVSGCDKSNSSLEDKIVYPKTGKYGQNILAKDFLVAQKTINAGNYSIKAELPAGNTSLKIIIKSTKQISYICTNRLQPPPLFSICNAEFSEWHEICPECGGKNTFFTIVPPFVGWISGSEYNWLIISNVENKFTFTFVDELVHKDGKVADASVTVSDDFIIEYYENGATEPTKVKEVKVTD